MAAITIRHSHAAGTLVEGTSRADRDLHQIMKAHRLCWSRQLGCWYVPCSRDRNADLQLVDRLAVAFRKAGATVQVQVDDTPRGAAEREHDRAERLEERRDRLEDRVDRLAGQSQAADQRGRQITDQIPVGQPILVGHHSERRHRRDLDRAGRAMRQAFELAGQAETATDQADASRQAEAHRMSGPATMRRIDTLEADRRRLLRRLAGRLEADLGLVGDDGGQRLEIQGFHRKPPSEEYAAQLRAQLACVDDDLAFWRAHLQGLKDRGEFTQYGPTDFAEGDRVQVNGWKGTVLRVNRKSLTVHRDGLPAVFDGPVDYSKVRPLTEEEPRP
jgi:hypothetical protein